MSGANSSESDFDSVVMCNLAENIGTELTNFLNEDRVFSCTDDKGFELQVVTYSDVCEMIYIAVKKIKDT